MDLHSYRQQYKKAGLDRHDLPEDPVQFFQALFIKAKEGGVIEPNAMTLATGNADGFIDARMVLLKEVKNGDFVFFTNYNSVKGHQLASNPFAALVFWWYAIECQVRVRGTVTKLDESESDAYFNSRPHDSKAGAIASNQSEVVADYDKMMDNFEDLRNKSDAELLRPSNWGGFCLQPAEIEFWQGRPNRMHDRFLYLREGEQWRINRLSP